MGDLGQCLYRQTESLNDELISLYIIIQSIFEADNVKITVSVRSPSIPTIIYLYLHGSQTPVASTHIPARLTTTLRA